MSSAERRIRPVVIAGLLALLFAVGLTACGDDSGSSDATGSATTTTTTTAVDSGSGKPVVGSGSDFDAQAIYADAAPSVVTILSLVGESDNPTSAGQGSGFVISDDGEIVTNAHVVTDATEAGGSTPINEADEVYVEFGDRNQVPAEIVGTDLNADVALIKVEPDVAT